MQLASTGWPRHDEGMRQEKSKRIELNPNQGGLAALGQALSGLDLGNLPPPPPKQEQPEPVKKRKLGRVVLRKETAHRGGKAVIVVDQFPATVSDVELEDLAKMLRKALGTGGTVQGRTIEMQGDQPAKIRSLLMSAGYDVGGV